MPPVHVKPFSTWHLRSHPSPPAVFPSSHCEAQSQKKNGTPMRQETVEFLIFVARLLYGATVSHREDSQPGGWHSCAPQHGANLYICPPNVRFRPPQRGANPCICAPRHSVGESTNRSNSGIRTDSKFVRAKRRNFTTRKGETSQRDKAKLHNAKRCNFTPARRCSACRRRRCSCSP